MCARLRPFRPRPATHLSGFFLLLSNHSPGRLIEFVFTCFSDEKEIMKNVPIKMQTDIAIHVHMDTLSKVSLFQVCLEKLISEFLFHILYF